MRLFDAKRLMCEQAGLSRKVEGNVIKIGKPERFGVVPWGEAVEGVQAPLQEQRVLIGDLANPVGDLAH
jgi:hypothetical protein